MSLTGFKSRFVATFAGAVLIVLGLIPKLGGIVEGIPQAVLGGAGVALFGMVSATGIRTLTRVTFNNSDILVVAISVGLGLLPDRLTDAVQPAADRAVHRIPLRHLGRGDRRHPAQSAAQLEVGPGRGGDQARSGGWRRAPGRSVQLSRQALTPGVRPATAG